MTDLFSDDDFDIPESAETAVESEEFDIDSLRASSARAGSMYDEDMEDMDIELVSSGGAAAFSLSNFTPGQRLILAVLLLFDILAIGVGLLLVTGVL